MRFTSKVTNALRAVPAILVLCCAAGTTMAQAADATCPADSPVNRQACLREVAAAKQAGRSGALTSPDASAMRNNALARCAVFKTPTDRTDCEARVTNSRQDGSVLGGGELLRAETPVKAD